MVQPESRISRAIIKEINARGGFAFKIHGSEHMMAGLPDIIAVYQGLHIGIETKTPEGKDPTARQSYVHKRMRASGAIVMVARTVADVSAMLDSIDECGGDIEAATGDLRDCYFNANGRRRT